MATKASVLNKFFNRFLTAYPATAVPDDAKMPYITYDAVLGAYGDGEQAISANVWYRTTSEAEPNATADRISKAVGASGVILPCDGGGLWLKRGIPFCQTVADTDNTIKRRYLNFVIEYMTTD